LRLDSGDYVDLEDEADFDLIEAITGAARMHLETVYADWLRVVTKGDLTWRPSTLSPL